MHLQHCIVCKYGWHVESLLSEESGESDNPPFCGTDIRDKQGDILSFLQAFSVHSSFIYIHFRDWNHSKNQNWKLVMSHLGPRVK